MILDFLNDRNNHLMGTPKNYLPNDGTANYYGRIFTPQRADDYLKRLLTGVEWQNDQVIIFGKEIITKRKVAWYGDRPFKYSYSKKVKQALFWTKELFELKTMIEKISGETFNSCLLNLYHTGEEGMGWHSDDEPELKKEGAIASLSFGAERKFSFKHRKSKERIDVLLEHGSLLLMKGRTQSFWIHSLPQSKRVTKPRINLTFRTIISMPI